MGEELPDSADHRALVIGTTSYGQRRVGLPSQGLVPLGIAVDPQHRRGLDAMTCCGSSAGRRLAACVTTAGRAGFRFRERRLDDGPAHLELKL